MCNNYLPVEKGRLYKQDLINRKCRLCNLNEIGDDSIIYLSGIFYRLLLYPIDYAELLM